MNDVPWTDEHGNVRTSGPFIGSYVMNCQHCGGSHQGQCPRIKAIEYDEKGNVKRIEFKE